MSHSPLSPPRRGRWLRAAGLIALPALVGGVVALVAAPSALARRAPVAQPPRPPRPLPPPVPLNAVKVRSITVNATVRDGIAETEVSHVFLNRSGRPQEGDFVFPIPAGATVSSFAMYDGETKLDAKLLDADEAIRTYEAIVRSQRDPALLTFQGRGALRARVFPIAPGGERRVTVKLVTVLPREGDARKYAWTLVGPYLPNKERPESLSVRVAFDGKQPVGNVYSPTHEIRVRRDSETKVVASWELRSDDPLTENTELDVYVTPGKGANIALSALTYNASLPQVASIGGAPRESGYFLVVASPTLPDAKAAANALPRRVALVMDRSGSMQGKKIEQAKAALKFALGKLRPQDSFNVLTFSDRVEKFAPEPVAATPDNLKRAGAFVDDIVADGGTNIGDALQQGLATFPERGSGNTLLFFTDGLPTVGERSQERILKSAVETNGKKARCFVFGVGYDVDVPFLDQVALSLRGDADYVRPDESIEVKTSQFVAKTSTPVLENLKLRMEGVRTGEIYPKPEELPDIFAGSQLVLVGRYTGNGPVKMTLTGEANGKPQTYQLTAAFPAVETGSDFLPRLWASRKIGYLMDEVRLREEPDVKREMIQQIVSLSREFGILTPYTALFVPEPGTPEAGRPLNPNGPPPPVGGVPGGFGGGGGGFAEDAAKPAPRQGEAAVNASQGARGQKGQATVGNVYAYRGKAGEERKKDEETARRVRTVNNRAFYQQGPVWTDSTYDPAKQKTVVRVKLYSDAYFALTRRDAAFAKWAALGENVLIAAANGQAVQFGNDGKEKLTDAEVDSIIGKKP
jgi:Ca-activated chloride channel homolog